MKKVCKYLIAILVIMVALNTFYYGSRMSRSKLDYKHSGTYPVAPENSLRSQDSRNDISTTWNDPVLKAVVTSYEHNLKGNPFRGRVQVFLKTLVHLTRARQNNKLWQQLDLMSLPPFSFDPEFHNPCWWSSTMLSDSCDTKTTRFTRGSHMTWISNYKNVRHKKPFFRCLPYFYVIGQAKCGTTDLFSKLIKHPDVASINRKETQWICRLRLQPRETCSSIDAYISMFQHGADSILHNHKSGSINPFVTGEATPGYFSYNDFWDLLPGNEGCGEPCVTNADILHHITPGAKIILILRDPTDRLYSHYFHKHGIYNKPTSREHFHHLVLREIGKFQKCLESQSLRGCCYNYTVADSLTELLDLRRGVYHVFLSDWLKVFPREQIHVVKFEDYIKNGIKHLVDIFKFLKLGVLSEEELAEINHRPPTNRRPASKRQIGDMWNSTRNILNQFYRPFAHKLSVLVKDDSFFW